MSEGALQRQTALVTGASRGLGREIALLLARDGARVIVRGRDADQGAATVESIRSAGGQADFVAARRRYTIRGPAAGP